MGSAGFTPGPWTVSTANASNFTIFAGGFLQNGGRVAYTAISQSSVRVEEGRANAHLIALAPELYQYVESSAQNGCATAQALIAKLGGEA